MDDKLLLAVVAAISAAVGGVITSVLAPWVKHRIERKATEIDRKRQLISDWRQMVITIANSTSEPGKACVLLQSHPAFLSLEPHLSEEARRVAYAPPYVIEVGVEIPYPLQVIKEDIMRIEKSWGLV
ncbi:MAG: hypothetical protein AB1831_00300 [Pseudomonadota bacterium]